MTAIGNGRRSSFVAGLCQTPFAGAAHDLEFRNARKHYDKDDEIPSANHMAPDVFPLDGFYLHVYFLFTKAVAVDSGCHESQNDLAQWRMALHRRSA